MNIQDYIQYWQHIYMLNGKNKIVVVKENTEPKKHRHLLGEIIELLVAPFRRFYDNTRNSN